MTREKTFPLSIPEETLNRIGKVAGYKPKYKYILEAIEEKLRKDEEEE